MLSTIKSSTPQKTLNFCQRTRLTAFERKVGERIKLAAAEQLPSVHPDNPSIHTVNQTLFAGPVTLEECLKRQKTLWSFRLAGSTAVLVVLGAPREWL
jgi:proline racemase